MPRQAWGGQPCTPSSPAPHPQEPSAARGTALHSRTNPRRGGKRLSSAAGSFANLRAQGQGADLCGRGGKAPAGKQSKKAQKKCEGASQPPASAGDTEAPEQYFLT